jgi:zinc protease
LASWRTAGIDLGKVEAAIDVILADVLKNGVTQKELDRVRNQAIAERIYTLDNQAALARMAGVALTTGLSARSIFDRDVEIEKVTLDDIRLAAAKFIVLKRSVTGILLPETQTLN